VTVANYDGMWPPPALAPEAYVYDSDGSIVGDTRDGGEEPGLCDSPRAHDLCDHDWSPEV
jgi:hypothetical protein